MKFSIKNLSSKCDQIRRKIWSHLLKKSLIENFIFCAVNLLCHYSTVQIFFPIETSVCTYDPVNFIMYLLSNLAVS